LNRGNWTAGLNQLAGFQNKVRAQVAAWDSALARELIAVAQKISDAVGER
jgi:hypothetical protein